MEWSSKKGKDWLWMVLRSLRSGLCVALLSCKIQVWSPAMVELDLLSRVLFFFPVLDFFFFFFNH